MEAPNRAGGTVVAFSAIGNALVKQDGDGRMAARRRVLKSGIAASNDRRLTVNCTVRDISDTGARLRVEGSMTVPDTFELLIPLDGLEAPCQVVWRKGGDVGVKFLSAPRIAAQARAGHQRGRAGEGHLPAPPADAAG